MTVASASTTTTTSSGTVTGTGSVNLSSPESAYSTGYSTDGTSPGTSFPPEYYINIRTGTHYFQSNGNNGRPKRPTDSPATLTDLSTAATLLSGHGNHDSTASLANMTRDNDLPRDIRSNTPQQGTYDRPLSLSLLKEVQYIWDTSLFKGGDHCLGPKSKGVFGNLFQPNNASKSIYCVV